MRENKHCKWKKFTFSPKQIWNYWAQCKKTEHTILIFFGLNFFYLKERDHLEDINVDGGMSKVDTKYIG